MKWSKLYHFPEEAVSMTSQEEQSSEEEAEERIDEDCGGTFDDDDVRIDDVIQELVHREPKEYKVA